MRSLFLRLFLAFWVAMTLIGAAFALIYAFGMARLPSPRFQRLVAQTVQLRGQHAARCLESASKEVCGGDLRQLTEDASVEVALYRDGALVLGGTSVPDSAALVDRVLAGEPLVKVRTAELDIMALPVTDGAGRAYVVVGARERTPWWLRFVVVETLPHRLLVLLLVSGLLSYLLARYLTRPLVALRRATQRIAEGDLSVRVTGDLVAADRETQALGRDFDHMAERIGGLIEAHQRLVRDVSHELRSPLARLHVALGLARQHSGPEAAAPLDRIEREAERLGDLVGEALMVSRLDAQAFPERVERVDAGELLAEVVRDVAFEAHGNGRGVSLEREGEAPVDGNEELLRRALENVLRNAVRFTDERGVDVALTRREGEIEVRVRDYGPGVPEAELAAIFEPFYRVGSDRDRSRGGTGIGLAIAQRAIALHGGTITAENAPGGGLVVTVRLPAASAIAAAAE